MWKTIVGAVAVVAVIGAVWFFTQGPGVEMLHKDAAPASAPVDTGTPAPAPQPEAAQPAPQPQPAEAQPAPQAEPAPATNGDASQDRGMKFLLNQGKN